ncbi:DUF58 domain-containing protein [Janibacter indicus]|uniref:DUF58 domain-containing protein n=1 Tax=Janibacter indicus TaxID=857417 RepID=A0A1L3MKM2_9MICO|nr:DUF58 domain-containing protein [Janibacter indicus]APH02871.1 hypothetical protein ASJ30_16120 [Janibacter indicus]QOK22841.1 DUF58 domain-containing protein [Janibacter indicus]
MTRLVHKVKGKLSIHVRRRSVALLDGGYASVHKGRSMDFDDLREYAVGDDIRDIDWKASARHGSMLIKRYVAERHFSLIIVMPAGREMAATAAGGEPKREIAVLAAGVLGWLAIRHGDDVAMISGAPGRIHATRARSSEGHLEHLLQETLARSQPDSPSSDLPGLLRHITRNVKGRKVLLVVADDGVEPAEVEDTLRSLRLRHEVIWVDVADLDPLGVDPETLVRDVAVDHPLPDLLLSDRELAAAFTRSESTRRHDIEAMLRRTDVSSARAGHTDEVVPMIVKMLERRRRGR